MKTTERNQYGCRWMCHNKPKEAFHVHTVVMCVYVSVPSVVSLSERRLHVYPRAYVLVTQEAGVGGQGIMGKNRVVIRGAGA